MPLRCSPCTAGYLVSRAGQRCKHNAAFFVSARAVLTTLIERKMLVQLHRTRCAREAQRMILLGLRTCHAAPATPKASANITLHFPTSRVRDMYVLSRKERLVALCAGSSVARSFEAFRTVKLAIYNQTKKFYQKRSEEYTPLCFTAVRSLLQRSHFKQRCRAVILFNNHDFNTCIHIGTS